MRFVLDQNVNARLCTVLGNRGHECWTADNAAMSEARDDALTVYAMDRGAAVITHDKEFSRRRRRNVIGQHVHLRCPEPDAIEVLTLHIEEVLDYLSRHEHISLRVTRAKVTPSYTWT